MTAGTIHLACATDGAYAPHTGTMLHSLLATNPGKTFQLHVLRGDLSPEDAARLKAVASGFGATLDFIAIKPEWLRGFPDARFHRSCWYRLLLPELFRDLPKILYLDSDIIVTDQLRPLWETDLSKHCFAAVTNPLYPFMPDFPRERLGIPDPRRYFNSGVLLMNLDSMRARHYVKQLRSYATVHPDNLYPEQDALSALFHADGLALPPRWNAQSTLWDLAPAALPFAADEIREAKEHPTVVHFIGPYKPWQYLCRHPLRHLYFTHRRATAWPVTSLEGKTLRNIVLKPFPLACHDRWHKMESALRERVRRLRRLEHKG